MGHPYDTQVNVDIMRFRKCNIRVYSIVTEGSGSKVNLDLFSGFIGAIIGSLISINVQKMNELDSKSGWRKKLFELASKDKMSLDDVFLLRTTLRYTKHSGPNEAYSFKFMSNQITDFCESIISYYENNESADSSTMITNKYDREKIRIYARYLLKNHWEVFSSKILFLSYEFKLSKEHEFGRNTDTLIRNVEKVQMEAYLNE